MTHHFLCLDETNVLILLYQKYNLNLKNQLGPTLMTLGSFFTPSTFRQISHEPQDLSQNPCEDVLKAIQDNNEMLHV